MSGLELKTLNLVVCIVPWRRNLMYAIINTGGKQYKVEEGDEIVVERIHDEANAVKAIMIVDGKTVVSSKSDLEKAKIGFSIVGNTTGNKIDGFNYKNKSNQRKRYGHRQKYNVIKIEKITA